MANIRRYTWNWSGFLGSPGVTTLITTDDTAGQTAAVAFDVFLFAQRARMPDDVHILINPEYQVLDDEDGTLISVGSAPSGSAIDGANTGPYSAASGLCISWGTNGIVGGRKVRGRTFLVPMSGAYFDTNGTLNDTELGGTRSDLATFRGTAGSAQKIWSRPRPNPADPTNPFVGSSYPVTSAVIRDRAAILRSRRD